EPYAFDARVGFYDTTLRDGEQTVGVVLTPEDKLELARGLDELGIERIEAGFPRVSADDRRAVELIRDAGLRAEVWGFSRAVDAGAHEVVVVDTIGIATPEAVADLVGRTRDWLGADRPIHFHGHNDFGLATAAAVAAVRAGANWIQGTVNGMGERAGNANLPEIALALRGLYGVETKLRLELVRGFSERLRALS